jgi:hypothetical protein
MIRFVAAAALAIFASACVSTAQDRIPDTADTPKIWKAIAITFMNSVGHNWLIGTLPLRSPSIAGPFQKTGSSQQHFCITAIWLQGPFRKIVEAEAYVEQVGTKVSVSVYPTRLPLCQSGYQPFRDVAEIVAQKTGVSVEEALGPPPPSF